jgi:UDP-glucuronate 4-epimerase
MKLLVTGAAGFIGMHTVKRLLERGDIVFGFDNLNNYYDPKLKLARLKELSNFDNFSFIKGDLSDQKLIIDLFSAEKFDAVVHLAAQAGVRYSVSDPHSYADCNLSGFLNILEGCRYNQISHLVFASSSSVYGGNTKTPFSESDSVDHPLSLYAATKRANELMAHSYSHLYQIPITGLRFFTVYGPWGRPDQSLFLFVNAILKGEPIKIFNNGEMLRDFTYIDDVVQGVVRILDKPATGSSDFDNLNPCPHIGHAPYRIFNVGNGRPLPLMDFIDAVENSLGVVAEKFFLPLQAGDVVETFADCRELNSWVDFRPSTAVQEGVDNFVKWYREFYKK